MRGELRLRKLLIGWGAVVLVLALSGWADPGTQQSTQPISGETFTAPLQPIEAAQTQMLAQTEDGETEDGETEDSETPTTEPPDTETTTPEQQPGGDDGDVEAEPSPEPADVPVWAWVLAGAVLIIAVAWMISRSLSGNDTE